MPISNLVYTDKFKKWFDTTNTVISTLNGITVYNLLAGDGIGVTSANNVFTVSHGTNVATGVTFSGAVNFTGTVTFTTNPTTNTTTVIAISPKISGLTSGNVVRVDTTGLTLAKANSAVNSEVLGMVVGENSNANIVAVAGGIDNTTFSKTIQNALNISGGTLSPGQAYFLDPVVAGGITTNEPQIYGQVSKPILLGITGNSGSLLMYRGILLEGVSYGITAELDNKIIIEIDYGVPVTTFTGNSVKIGDPICYYSDTSDAISSLNSVGGKLKVDGKLNNSTNNCTFIPDMSVWTDSSVLTGKEFLGLVSRIISNSGSKYVLEVTLPGGSFTTTATNLDTNFYSSTAVSSPLSLNTSAKLVQAVSGNTKFLDFIHANDGFNTVKITLNVRISTGVSTLSSSFPVSSTINGITVGLEYYNLIPNGAFTVWQRPGITKYVSGATQIVRNYDGDYLTIPLSFSQTTGIASIPRFYSFVADRWFCVFDRNLYTVSGRDVLFDEGSQLIRKTFASDQIEVPGSPLFYLDCKFKYAASPVAANKRPSIQNFQVNARLLQNQKTTFSFWAKSTVPGATIDVVYNRYKDEYTTTKGLTTAYENRINVTIIDGGVTLDTVWKQYKRSFDGSVAGFTLSPNETGWYSIGWEFPSSTATISIAQAQLAEGNSISSPISLNYNEEFKRCRPYYFSSFDPGVTYGKFGPKTILTDRGAIRSTVVDGSKLAKRVMFTGFKPGCNFSVPIEWEMIKIPRNGKVYSVLKGFLNHITYASLDADDIDVSNSDPEIISQGLPWQTQATPYPFVPNISNFTLLPGLSSLNSITFETFEIVPGELIMFDYVLESDIPNYFIAEETSVTLD